MLDKTLLRIAFITSMIGIIALFFISRTIQSDEQNVFLADDETDMRIQARLIAIESFSGVTRLTILVEDPIDAIIFDGFQESSVKLGSTYTFYAKRSSYRGRPELLVSRIE